MKTRHIICIVAGVVGVQVVAGLMVYGGLDDWATRGQFGDMFGFVNALFSGLAFAGVIVAILLQREELRLQRRDLKLQREELELTREELRKSADAQGAQAGLLLNSARINALSTLFEHQERAVKIAREAHKVDPFNVKCLLDVQQKYQSLLEVELKKLEPKPKN